jgi:hypothetical protein
MVSPGVLRGRPGPRLATTLTSRPRRSLSSPRMLLPVQCSRVLCSRVLCSRVLCSRVLCSRVLCSRVFGLRHDIERNRRGPGPLEEPTPPSPKALLRGWRGLTPRWPRSLRLGSASAFKVARHPPPCNPQPALFPLVPKKNDRTKPCLIVDARLQAVRQCLSVLPQWIHGQQ